MILGICGSPREGNTEFMMKTILDSAKGETELILLKEKNFSHCKACDYCKTHDECIIKDDVKGILDKMAEADIIVLGSPVYCANVSGLMKNLMDRMRPLFPELKLKDKKSAGVIVGGAPVDSDSVQRTAEIMKIFCTGNYRQMEFLGNFIASSRDPKDVAKQEDTIQKMKEFGEKLE